MVSVYVNKLFKIMCDAAFSQAAFFWNKKNSHISVKLKTYFKK